MIELVRHLAAVCAIGLGLAVPAWADEPLHGQVIGVVGGDIITLVDVRQREHQLRLAFIDAPAPGQPFADEAQSALSAMVLGRQVTAQIRGRDRDGITLVEVVEPHGHIVNLELVRRGLAWRDYFDEQNHPDREQYQAALSKAQRARQGLWSQDRVEAPRDFRARVSQYTRWWLYAVAGLACFTLLGLVFSIYEKRISAWLERQDEITKASAEAYRQARIQAEAEQAERDRTREIANQEMDRLAAERRRRELA
ncbi:thermonuclease family protein [Roseateles sp.]|jgi:endonuclease YncB( thermonuclease family)|uniref:thermonuclease family protein n=1 Tax=Roseateles sp. TaxID=1971397 RepID=UPI00391BEDCE